MDTPFQSPDMHLPILVVDDDEMTRRLISGALQARGVNQIEEAASLSEAGKAISAKVFGAAIVDLHLPDGNGMEFVHMVRRGLASRNHDALVIISSAFISPRTSALLTRLGATEIMRKPPDIDKIVALMSQRQAA